MGAHDGRVAVVTGGASGIGRATAERIEAEGGSVVAVDLNAEQLSWTDGHERIEALAGDITEQRVNEEAVALAVERFGGLDATVLNAGKPKSGDLLELPIEEFDDVMNVNVRAVLLGIRSAVPALRQRSPGGGGAIAITASTSGMAGDPNMWPYNTSKAAVINLMRGAALDLGPFGIRVNAVAPGPTESGMTTRLLENTEAFESLRRRTALQRWGRSEEVAAVLSFLVSPDASIVTGALVPADSGISANTGQFLPAERP